MKAPLKKWQGITLRDGRVTTMNLSHMGLTGHLPEVIQYLDQLDTLILSKNEFSGPVPYVIGHLKNLVYLDLSDNNFQGAVPEAVNGLENLIFCNFQNNFFDSFPTITLNNLDSLNLENNKFSFNDLIPNLDAARDSVYYIPQKTIGDTVHYLAFNGEMFSYAWTGHDENIYQWYKAGNDTVISKADNLQFRLFTASDTGLYHCTYTNPNVPGLELTSAPVILKEHPALQIFPDSLAVGDNVADGTQLGSMYLNTNEPAWFEFIGESYCFDLQHDEGVITVSNLSEHDSVKQYDVNVAITLAHRKNVGDTFKISIAIIPVIEPPILEPHTFTVYDGSANGTSVGFVQPHYLDEQDSAVYSLYSNPFGIFSINERTGEVFVNDSSYLDFEKYPEWIIIVEVRNKKTHWLSDTATVKVLVQNTNSAENHDLYNTIRIYPNPANHNISIEFPSGSNDVQQISVVSVTGNTLKIMKAAEMDGNRVMFGLHALSSGTYFIRIITELEIFNIPFIRR